MVLCLVDLRSIAKHGLWLNPESRNQYPSIQKVTLAKNAKKRREINHKKHKKTQN